MSDRLADMDMWPGGALDRLLLPLSCRSLATRPADSQPRLPTGQKDLAGLDFLKWGQPLRQVHMQLIGKRCLGMAHQRGLLWGTLAALGLAPACWPQMWPHCGAAGAAPAEDQNPPGPYREGPPHSCSRAHAQVAPCPSGTHMPTVQPWSQLQQCLFAKAAAATAPAGCSPAGRYHSQACSRELLTRA